MEKKKTGALQKKLDRIFAYVFLTPEGKPKSAQLLYSFCLSLLFFVVYAIAYVYLIDALEGLLGPTASVAARNLLESLIPGLCGSAVCCALFFAPMDKALVPYAYIWLCAFALTVLVMMIFLCDADEFRVFLYFFTMLVPSGLISGTFLSQYLYRQRMKRCAADAQQ